MKTYGTTLLRPRAALLCLCLLLVQILTPHADAYTNTIIVHWSGWAGGSANYPYLALRRGSYSTLATWTTPPYTGTSTFEHTSSQSGDKYAVYHQAGGAYSLSYTADINGAGAGGEVHIYFTFNGGASQPPPPADTNWYFRHCWKNTTSYRQTYQYSAGVSILATATANPGQTVCTALGPFLNSKPEILMTSLNGTPLTQDGDGSLLIPPETPDECPDCGVTWQAGSAPGGQPNGVGDNGGLPTNSGETNIAFTGSGSDLFKESTGREGFSAIREAIVNGSAITHQGLQDVVVAVDSLGTSLSAIQSSAATIASGVSSVNTAIAGVKSDTATLVTGQGTANAKLTSIDTGVASLGTKLEDVKSEAQKTTASSVAQSNLQVAANTKLDGLGTKLDTANGKLAEIDSNGEVANVSLASVDSKLTTLNTKVQAGNDALAYLPNINTEVGNTRIAAQSSLTMLTSINSSSATIAEKVTSLNTKQDTANSTLSSINSGVSGLGAGLDGVNSKLTTANNHLSTISGFASTIDSTLEGIYNGQELAATQAHDDAVTLRNSLGGIGEQLTNANANLRTITNQLTSKKLTQEEIDDFREQGDAAGQAAFGGIKSMGESMTPGVIGGSALDDAFWTVHFGNKSFNLNPMANAGMSTLAQKVRLVVAWIIAGSLFFLLWNKAQLYIMNGTLVPQTHSNKAEILGNSVGVFSGPIFATFICASIATIPTVVTVMFTTMDIDVWAATSVWDYFASAGGAVGQGFALANQFIPFDILTAAIINYFVATASMSFVYGVAAFTIKYFFA